MLFFPSLIALAEFSVDNCWVRHDPVRPGGPALVLEEIEVGLASIRPGGPALILEEIEFGLA